MCVHFVRGVRARTCLSIASVCVCVCVHARACVRARVRARVRACVCVCACVRVSTPGSVPAGYLDSPCEMGLCRSRVHYGLFCAAARRPQRPASIPLTGPGPRGGAARRVAARAVDCAGMRPSESAAPLSPFAAPTGRPALLPRRCGSCRRPAVREERSPAACAAVRHLPYRSGRAWTHA